MECVAFDCKQSRERVAASEEGLGAGTPAAEAVLHVYDKATLQRQPADGSDTQPTSSPLDEQPTDEQDATRPTADNKTSDMRPRRIAVTSASVDSPRFSATRRTSSRIVVVVWNPMSADMSASSRASSVNPTASIPEPSRAAATFSRHRQTHRSRARP